MRRIFIMLPVALTACAFATQISNDVTTACNWVKDAAPLVETVAPVTVPGLTSVVAMCTAEGMVQASINDTQPVTPTNSGASASWAVTTLQAIAAQFGIKLPTPPALSTTAAAPALT